MHGLALRLAARGAGGAASRSEALQPGLPGSAAPAPAAALERSVGSYLCVEDRFSFFSHGSCSLVSYRPLARFCANFGLRSLRAHEHRSRIIV